MKMKKTQKCKCFLSYTGNILSKYISPIIYLQLTHSMRIPNIFNSLAFLIP